MKQSKQVGNGLNIKLSLILKIVIQMTATPANRKMIPMTSHRSTRDLKTVHTSFRDNHNSLDLLDKLHLIRGWLSTDIEPMEQTKSEEFDDKGRIIRFIDELTL